MVKFTYDDLPDVELDEGYGLFEQDYETRRERYREDPDYQNKVRAVGLTGAMIGSVFLGTVLLAGTAAGETAQPAIDAIEQLEPSTQSAFEALDP